VCTVARDGGKKKKKNRKTVLKEKWQSKSCARAVLLVRMFSAFVRE
jgi:hypothetical protein